MKMKILMIFGVVLVAVFELFAASAIAQFEQGTAVEVKGDSRFSAEVNDANGQPTLKLESRAGETAKGNVSIAYYVMPIEAIQTESQGLSFEIKAASGSSGLASVMLASDKYVLRGYEATFFIDDTEWTQVVIGWDAFVPNFKPWDKHAKNAAELVLDPTQMTRVAFGRGNHFQNHYPEFWGFDVRAVKAVNSIPARVNPEEFSKGLSRVRSLVDARQPLKILLLGDSITEHGRDASYGHHVAQLIQQRFGVSSTVVNAGVGGHSVRGGRLVLKRSLSQMPDPDLVFIMYGANDSKAVPIGLNADVFKSQLEMLIDDVRCLTEGEPDIVLLTGVPRLDTERMQTANIVEPIVPGIHSAADARETALVDTFSIYLNFSQDEIDAYYKDTVHPSVSGHEYLGTVVFEQIVEQL